MISQHDVMVKVCRRGTTSLDPRHIHLLGFQPENQDSAPQAPCKIELYNKLTYEAGRDAIAFHGYNSHFTKQTFCTYSCLIL